MAIVKIDYDQNIAKNITIKQLLVQATRLTIPEYQRDYVYGWTDAKKFITFVFENQINHQDSSLGQIVTYVNSIDDIQIIDGQQRITTFFITLIQIYRIIQNKFYNTQLGSKMLFDIGKHIITETEDGQCMKLCNSVHQEYSINDIINLNLKGKSPYRTVSRQIYNFLCNYKTIEDLYILYDYIMNHINFTCYECKTESEALIMFNNINKAGRRLSVKDNIKALFYYLYKNKDTNIITNKYKEIVEILNRIDISQFIEIYTRFYEYNMNKQYSIAYAIEFICNKYFNGNIEDMLEDIKEYAIYYVNVLNGNNKLSVFSRSINKKYHVIILSFKSLNRNQIDKIIDKLIVYFGKNNHINQYKYDYTMSQFAKSEFKDAYNNFINFIEGNIETTEEIENEQPIYAVQ